MKKTILALALLSTFASCKKDLNVVESTTNTYATAERGVLAFQDTNDLNAANINGVWAGFYGNIPAGTWQYLWANNTKSWGTTAYVNGTETWGEAGVGVRAYPSARRYYGSPGKKWTDFNQFVSSVTFTNPQANSSTVGLSYNTSYDYFYHSSTGAKVYEIMIWLNAEGRAKTSVAGDPVGNVVISGYTWTLYKARGASVGNGYRTVWSFVRTYINQNNTQTFNNLNIKAFSDYLTNSGISDTENYNVNINNLYLNEFSFGFEYRDIRPSRSFSVSNYEIIN